MSQGTPFRALSPSNFQDYYDYNRAPSPFSPVPGVPSSGAWRSVSPIPSSGGASGVSLKPTQLPPQTRWSWTPPTSQNLSEPLPISPTPLMTSSLVHPIDYEILNLNFSESKSSTKSSKVSSTSERLSVSTPNVNINTSVNLQSQPSQDGNGFLSGFERQIGYELVDSRDTSTQNFQSFNVDLQPCFDAEFVYPPGMGPNAPKSVATNSISSTSKRSKSESRVTQKKQQFQSYQQQFQSQSQQQQQQQQSVTGTTTTTTVTRQTPLSYEVFGGQLSNQQGQHIQFSNYQGQSSSTAEIQAQAELQYLPSQYEQVVQTVWYDNSAERTAEYQSAIYHLQDERERVQMKTFAKWINSCLKKHGSKIQIENLLYDLTDGVTLLTLIQLLSGQKLPVERGRRRHHFLCNHNTLLEFLKANKIKLVNINACDLVDGRPTVTLGLIWTIILYFQIKGSLEESPPTPPHQPEQSVPPPPQEKKLDTKQDSLRNALLEWVRNLFAQNKVTQQVNDFGKSWRDGFAFLYLVNCLKPGLLDVEGLHFAPTISRLSTVFKVAEESLGIMKLLDAEDVDVPKPDEKSVMTYVAQFLHWYNNRPPEEPEPPKKVEPPPPPPPPPREPTPPPPPPQKDPTDDLLAEFEAQCKRAEEYLQRSEVTIKSLPKLFVGLSEKKNAVVRFQSELQELFDWQQNLESLNAKAKKLLELRGSDSRVSSLVVHLTTMFNQLLNLTKEINATLETHHMEHENYWQRFQETLEFLRKLRLGLEQYSDCQGDRPEITAKLEMLSEIEAGLKMGDELVNMTIEEGEATLKSTADDGQGAIRDQMSQLQTELQDLRGIAEERQKKLRSCLESWDKFEALYTQVDKNINEMETVLGQNFQQALDRCQKIMADISGLKPEVDQLSDQADNLMQRCQCPQVKDLAEAMKSRYSNLVIGVEEMCARIEKRLNNQMTFGQEVNEFDQWLKKKEDVIQQCNGEPPNEDIIRERLQLLKSLLLEIPQGQRLLYAVKDSMAAMEDIPVDQRDHLGDLERRWEILNDDLKNTKSDLEEGLLSWQRFRQNCDIFSKWCHSTMGKLSKMQPDGDLKQMLETLKNIGRDIQSKKADLQGLSDESQKLTSSSHPSPEVEELINLWNQVDGLVVQLSDQLEKEAKEQSDYKSCLQEVELWLLHTSTQLTATNSLRITNIDQAREQLNFHKTLISEIENYRQTLDNLSGKGYRLVEIYIASDPDIETVIAKQLKTVEDSYQQLFDTAREINMRLENSVREFQKYLDTLENIFQNLQQMDQDINHITGNPAQNFEALAERHNSFSGMHNKLQGEKIRLNLAVQSCQAATASVSRPSSPMDEEVPIPDMELQVRALIEDLIDRVQNEQGRCSSAHADMESVKAVKDGINGWLSEMAGKLRDIEGRPVPLCENTAKIERGQLETIKNGVHEKLGKLQEIELQEKGLIQGGYLPDLQTKLQKLDGDSESIIGSRGSFHDLISEFQNLLKNANSWIEGLSGKVEPLRKKGSGLSGAQRGEQLHGILDEFLEGHPKILQEVHSAAEKFMGALSTPDGEQVQEQIKGLRKRFQDFRVSLEKEGQNLEDSQKGFKDFLNDLLSFWEGGKRIKESLGTSKIGYAVPPAETMLSATQAKLQDFEGQKSEFLKFEQRLPSLKGELEAVEIQEAKDKLKEIQGCHDDLINDLRGYVDHLRNGIVLRKKFMEKVSFLRSFISGVTHECDSRTLPLLSGDVQGKLEKMKDIAESKIPEFQKTHLPEVRKDAYSLEQDCDPEQLTRLKQLIADLSLDHLLEKLRNYETRLLEALKERKSFEGYYSQCHNSILGMEKCIQNLEDSTATTTSEFGEPQYPDKKALEDKLTKFHLLLEDSQRINEDIQSLIEKGTEMVPSLNEPDQQSLKDKLKSLTSDLQNLKSSLEDKLDGTRDEIKNEEHVNKITAETKEYLGKLKDEVSALKKPVGFGIEDSAALLSAYEKLLADLKAYRQKLEDTPLKGLKSNAELQRLLCEQDTLAGQIEAEIEKLRRLLALQQQFLQLVTEITNFIVRYTDVVKEIEKSGTSPLEKAKRYEDAILRIRDCEGLLATAMEQGEIIAKEDTVAEEDRMAIMEQLHSLKAQLEGLRKTVEDQRARHLETCQKHAKFLDDLTKTIQWLQEKDATIKGKPLLERPSKSVEVELRRHDDFARDVKLRLNEIESILEGLKYDDGLPSLLTDKMVEGRSLLERIPGDLQSRHRYLLENKDIRQNHELEVDAIWGWVSEVKSKLGDKDQFGVNFDTVEQDLEIHNKSFGVSAKRSLQDQLNSVKDGVNRIWSSLIPYEQESLSKDQEYLNEAVQNIFNSAKNIQAKLEQGRSLYKTFLDLINSVNACISKSRVQEAPVSTVVSLRRNLGIVQDAQKQLQKEKVELDGLGEWAQSAQKVANDQSKEKIQTQMNEIYKNWNESLTGLESRKNILTKLAGQWEQCEALCQSFETGLSSVEANFSQVDLSTRSRQQVDEAKNKLAGVLGEVKKLEGSHREMLNCMTLFEASADSTLGLGALKSKVELLSKQYSNIMQMLEEKLEWLTKQLQYLDELEKKMEEFQKFLLECDDEIQSLDPFDKSHDSIDTKIIAVDKKLKNTSDEINGFSAKVKARFSDLAQILPTSVSKSVSNLQLELDKVFSNLDDKRKSVKSSRALVSEFERDVDSLEKWMRGAEDQLQKNLRSEPTQQKRILQNLFSELPGALYQMERSRKSGGIIAEKTKCPQEGRKVKDIVENIESELNRLKAALEERKLKIDEVVDFWQRFFELHALVVVWIQEQNDLLKEPIRLSSLEKTKQTLNIYVTAVKSLKGVGKQLSDMGKEADHVAEITSAAPLYEKLAVADQAKTDVEGQLLERSSLLQETVEEWEQFEKKLKESDAWLKKARQSIEAGKKKPAKEKLLAGVGVQRTKIGMALGKLQVHFNACIGGDPNVEKEQKEIDRALEQFANEVTLSQSTPEPPAESSTN